MNRGGLVAWGVWRKGDYDGWSVWGYQAEMGNRMDYDGCRIFMDYGELQVEGSSPKEKLIWAAMLQSGNKINTALSATGIWQNLFFEKDSQKI